MRLRVTLNSLSRKDIQKNHIYIFFKRTVLLLVWYYFWQHHKLYIGVVQTYLYKNSSLGVYVNELVTLPFFSLNQQ